MAKISNPFASRPSSPGPSPLATTARNFGPRVNVASVEEAARSARVTAEMQAGAEAMAPSFRPVETKAPYEPVTSVVIPVTPEAGGSDT
jgi:hypothetical protein